MKVILLLLLPFASGFVINAAAQEDIQVSYVGSKPHFTNGVLMTSSGFRGDNLKTGDTGLAKIYYTNQRSLDTVKSFISRSKWVSQINPTERVNNTSDKAKLVDVFKITGVGTHPLYVEGRNCLELFEATMNYLTHVGLGNSVASNAVRDLFFQCRESPARRNSDDLLRRQIVDTFRIRDTPRVRARGSR